MTRLGIPYLRPDDYFAEMLKSDQHMGKVKARMIRVQEGIQAAEQRRKPCAACRLEGDTGALHSCPATLARLPPGRISGV